MPRSCKPTIASCHNLPSTLKLQESIGVSSDESEKTEKKSESKAPEKKEAKVPKEKPEAKKTEKKKESKESEELSKADAKPESEKTTDELINEAEEVMDEEPKASENSKENEVSK